MKEREEYQTSEFKSLKQITAGIHACHDALRDGRDIERVYLRKGSRGEGFESIIAICKERRVPFSFVPGHKLDRLTNVNHQGAVALHALIGYESIEDIIPFLFEQGKSPICIVLDRITDVRNLGAMVRTAECLGAHCILVPDHGSAQITTEAIKTSAGAIGRLPICRTNDLQGALRFMQQSGLKLVAASERGAHPVYQTGLDGPLAIVMGSEEDGVSPAILDMVNETLMIPMTGVTGSLNVGVAMGMILYEAVKQRAMKG